MTICKVVDQYLDVPQGQLFVRQWESNPLDSSPPIILFHDSLGCVELWRNFPEELSAATGRKVFAYDRLGFGRSDQRDDKLDLDFIADEARAYFPAVREQLGFRRFIAFGHSVGGGMAVNCAADFAGDCEALITESAQVFPEDRTLQSIAAAKEQFKDERQVERLKKYHGEKASWVLEAWTDTWLHPGFAAWTLESILPRVTCPTLALHGVHDEYGSSRHPEMIAKLSGGDSRCEIIADTYHVPHRERAEAIVNIVSEFIATLKAEPENQTHVSSLAASNL